MNRQSVILDGLSSKTQLHPAAETCLHILKTLKIPHKSFNLAADSMGPCIDCRVCSQKTVGQCFRRDKGSELTARLSMADYLIILTEVRYGAYDQPVKQAIDRFSLMGTPYFHFRGGQMHHVGRYPGRFSQLVFPLHDRARLMPSESGSSTEREEVRPEERVVFESLVRRDAEILYCRKCMVSWLQVSQGGLKKTMEASILSLMDVMEREAYA